MVDTVCIRNIAWTAAFDASRGSHAYLKEADVVFAGNEIVHVGTGYDGPADVVVDGRSSFVMPGLIDVHAHPHIEPSFKGLREDHGVPEHFMSGMYERCQALDVSEGSDDIGRLAPGCKADLVVVDLSDVTMIPVRDPLGNLVYTAAERAVKDVYVDGIKVVSDRKVLTMDRADAAAGVAEAQARMIEAVPELDYAGRTVEQISPLSLPVN